MKRLRKYVTAAGIAAAMLMLPVACSGESAKKLETPDGLDAIGSAVTWNEVPNAVGFTVSINGAEYGVKSEGIDISEYVTPTESEYEFEIKVKADGDGKEYGDSEWSYSLDVAPGIFTYKQLKDGSYSLTKCTGARGKIVVPQYYDGWLVREIDHDAFRDNKEITEVIIPDDVTKIGGAFDGCTNLRSVKLPDNLTGLVEMFAECDSLEEINIPKSVSHINSGVFVRCRNIKRINVDEENETYKSDGNCVIRKSDNALVAGCAGSVIPDYVQKIEVYAFSYVAADEITIPSSVKKIGFNTFHLCEYERIILSEGLETIGKMAFDGCYNLAALHIPSTVTEIDVSALYHCRAVEELTVAEDNPVYKSDMNCILTKADDVVYMGCAGSVIPEYATAIGDEAFDATESIRGSVVIPKSVTKIGWLAFGGCTKLDNIILHDGITYIAGGAFTIFCGGVTVNGFKTGPDLFSVTIPDQFAYVKTGAVWTYSKRKGSEIGYDDGYAYAISVEYRMSDWFLITNEVNYKKCFPARLGYTFGGYSATRGGTERITAKEQVEALADENDFVRVYPIWIPNGQ